MAIVTVQKPDSLSMSGNLKELVLQSVDPVSVVLRAAGAIVLEETFYPGNGNLIHIGLTEVVKSHLSFTLPSSDVFIQPNLSKDFTVAYGEDSYTFRCIRSGKMHLNESATQFLTGNFLTWQPTQKAVTYYSPEWLTYYAPEDCTVRLRAYWEDGTNSTISLSGQSSGTCVSYNLQYAVIAGKFAGKRPMYYDVWVENPSGTRLSYVQRYVASEKQGEDENWYLFENSLGGIDSLRAYGALKDDPEYTHNLAVFGDESEEYRIDTNRLLTRNTGMLTPEEARWLQDMFVASRKYVYTLSGLYRIVFTSSNAKTDSANPPVSYSFTYRLSDGRPYLDIQRRTDLPENLVIPIPTGDTFFLPPRLAEFPKPTLSPDLLIPVQEPHTEVWGATTTGQIHDTVLNDLIRELDGLDLNPIQGEGGINVDIIKLNDLTIPSDTNVFSALRTLKEIADATDGLLVEVNDMFLRKDIDDTAHGNILFDKKIGSSIFIDGWEGKGWEIQSTGAAMLDSLRVRSDIYVGGNTGSPTFASGFTGWGWQIDTPTATGEMDNLFIRKTFTAYEIVYSQIYGLGGSQIVSDINKIARVEVMSDRYRCYMDDMDGLMLMNLRKGDGVRIQTRTGTTSIKYLFGRCIGVDSDYFDIAIPLIEGTGQPEAGDFALRWGNNEDTDRQGLIYLTTADSGAPFIDVYDGITDASTEGKLKARIGHLTGIRTQRGDQLSGYGAYLNGIYVENSTFILQNGDTIEQTFIAMNGKFESLIDSIRNDISAEGGNILVNSSFSQNTNYWTAANNVHFINVGGEYLWLDGSFYVEKDQVADIYNDNGQNVLRIRNTYILQQNAIMNIPDHTEEEEKAYSFSLFYKVLRPGSCGFGIPGTELYHEEQLPESDSYQKLSKVGKWNGEGDFELRFTGEILIYGVGLFSDEIADAIVKLQTQIDQTDEYIKLLATKDYVDSETGEIYVHFDSQLQITAEQMSGISTKVDNINNTIESAGWITQADGVTLFAKKEMESGKAIVNAINVGTDGILIQANRINLVGAVTFSMFDYSLQSTINGKANSSSLGNLAYEDYVTDSDLSNSLAQTIANKVSSSALKNFALNDGPDITKGDLANALQTEINNKLTGSATTSGNKLANVIINGQTLIAGGYIQSDLLYVDEIYANKGTIGAFSIGDYRLTNTDGHAGIDINYSVNQYARLNESAGATMVSARNDKGQAASFQAYGSGSTALYVIGNTGSMAIKGSGPISIYQRDGETWNMPGLLAIYYFTGLDGVPYMSYRWGNGASITSIRKTETGTYVFTTATGGSAVYPVVVNVASDQPVHFYIKDMSASGFTVKSYSLADNEFSARNAKEAYILLFGRNRNL
nr:MAG TPA: tail protein [Caudoviricetes sp.]